MLPDSGATMRPLMQMNIDGLKRHFAASQGDTRQLAVLEDELKRRKTPSARALLAQVQRTRARSGAGGLPNATTAPSSSEDTLPNSGAPSDPWTAEIVSNADCRCKELRATFTEEGELLARWGMTPALPDAAREATVAAWREILKTATTLDGRTITHFDRDMARAAELRQRAT